MEIDSTKYQTKKKGPPHKKAAVVDLIKSFIGDTTFYALFKKKNDAYTFWLKQVGKVTFSDALDMIKELETLPVKYNRAGVIINKLKEFNG